MENEILRMENITKIYTNGFVANQDISFSVRAGEVHALIGENGAGKTTLMKILFGLEDFQEGRILVDGEEVRFSSPIDAFGKGIGMVHQHFMQCDGLTVAENVVLGIEPGKGGLFDLKEAIRMTEEASEKFQLPVNARAMIRDISVGEKQKVELLKALIRGVRVLILDEPTAVLTPQETRELFNQLKFLRDSGYGIVFISHKLDEVIELCNRFTVLRRGKVTGSGDLEGVTESDMARLMVGRDVVLMMDKDPAKTGEPVLKVDDLTYVDKHGKKKIESLGFTVRKGEIVGIAGVEGNGQSELSDIITGMLKMTSGEVSIDNNPINNMTIREIRDLGVAHVSEDRMTFGCAQDLSIKDNIASIYLDDKNYTSHLLVNEKKLDQLVDQCIEDFEIACDSKNGAIRLLSGGNIQKVIVAREFLSADKLIIANQPTRGIDVGTAELIRKTLIRYSREKNIGVLLISSDLTEVMGISDRLLVMNKGKIAAHFEKLETVTDELLGEYMLGVKQMTQEEIGEMV